MAILAEPKFGGEFSNCTSFIIGDEEELLANKEKADASLARVAERLQVELDLKHAEQAKDTSSAD